MEELVTVDEVGGEDDSIIEPDLPGLEEYMSCPKESAEEEAVEKHVSPPAQPLEEQETSNRKSTQEESCDTAAGQTEASVTEKAETVLIETGPEEQKLSQVAPELPVITISDFPSEEFKAALEETCSEDKVINSGTSEEPMENHIRVLEDSKTQEVGQGQVTETITNRAQLNDGLLITGTSIRNQLQVYRFPFWVVNY